MYYEAKMPFLKLKKGNKTVTLQEVVGHNEKVGKDDEVFII